MSKIAIVFWSGTGNTETMANAVEAGAKEAGAEVTRFSPADFTEDKVADFDAIAFGCPAMGAEVLEESEVDPMFTALEQASVLTGKKVGLFGSYGWGDGEWMRNWEERCRQAGADLIYEGVICNETPDAAATEACKKLGTDLSH
ncbi:MAG: flavodoxin [Clostridiales bacterium]|nr:flavodoxin [Clostridiales bacterium]